MSGQLDNDSYLIVANQKVIDYGVHGEYEITIKKFVLIIQKVDASNINDKIRPRKFLSDNVST